MSHCALLPQSSTQIWILIRHIRVLMNYQGSSNQWSGFLPMDVWGFVIFLSEEFQMTISIFKATVTNNDQEKKIHLSKQYTLYPCVKPQAKCKAVISSQSVWGNVIVWKDRKLGELLSTCGFSVEWWLLRQMLRMGVNKEAGEETYILQKLLILQQWDIWAEEAGSPLIVHYYVGFRLYSVQTKWAVSGQSCQDMRSFKSSFFWDNYWHWF